MPEYYNPRGGPGIVGTYVPRPGWTPILTRRDREIAQQDQREQQGMTRNQIIDEVFARSCSKTSLDAAFEALREANLAYFKTEAGKGKKKQSNLGSLLPSHKTRKLVKLVHRTLLFIGSLKTPRPLRVLRVS
jgi:hypothetical protein